MTDMVTGWHRLHPLSPLVRSGRTAVGVLALIGITAAAWARAARTCTTGSSPP